MNFSIENKGPVSAAFLANGITNFNDACNYIAQLPYKRNTNKLDVCCVFKEGAGTCSTKHAVLRKLALENDYEEVQLMLGIFKMDKDFAPPIAFILDQYKLAYIPEAHNYLKIRKDYIDCTKPHAQYSDFQSKLLMETSIEYDQINEYKINMHKDFLRIWLGNYAHLDLAKVWDNREQCMQPYKKAKEPKE